MPERTKLNTKTCFAHLESRVWVKTTVLDLLEKAGVNWPFNPVLSRSITQTVWTTSRAPKCPILQSRGKWDSDPKSVSGTASPPNTCLTASSAFAELSNLRYKMSLIIIIIIIIIIKVNWFFALVGPIIIQSFIEICWLLLQYSCWQTHHETHKSIT